MTRHDARKKNFICKLKSSRHIFHISLANAQRRMQADPPVIYSMKATHVSALLCGLFLGHGPVKRFLLKRDPISRWSFRTRNSMP
jgi:hypothetical protein